MRRWAAALVLTLCASAIWAQKSSGMPSELRRPRLVVGLVVDQMRWDYLTRLSNRFGSDGFNRLMREGWNCNRTYINYLPSITAVGHTSIYTGSVPAFTGIIGNHFYIGEKYTYCTRDESVRGVGTTGIGGFQNPNASGGQQSPRNLLVTTISDELRLATNFRSKVIGVAVKDRASILPAGHSANAAYWLDDHSNQFITSTYYMEQLPQWVKDFNGKDLGNKYLAQLRNARGGDLWPLLYDEKSYVQSAPRDQKWEDRVGQSLKNSPWGMSITFEMAKAAVEGENLGQNEDGVPDMLCVSISSTDILGHLLSPNSIWMEDLFLRLDQEVASFLNFLDDKVGKDGYIFFLSADHGGSHNPHFMQENHIEASGNVPTAQMKDDLNAALAKQFPAAGNAVERFANMQVVFSPQARQSSDFEAMRDAACKWLAARPEIAYAFPAQLPPDVLPEPVRTYCINGYCPGRSGDIQLVFQSGYVEDYGTAEQLAQPDHIRKGTTHSVWNPDDTHIPLIFMGMGVPHGWDNRTHHITDIAATLASLLNIQEPSGCVGQTITFQ